MAKSVTIGNKTFKTKTELKAFCKEILYKNDTDVLLNEEDSLFLTNLIELHPESESKIGCGISSFTTKPNMGSRVFWLNRIDGTSTDFSYLNSITNPSRLSMVKKAGRNTVKSQILEYKNKNFTPGMICKISGLVIPNTFLAHVDHMTPTFDEIVTTFIAENKIDVNTIELDGLDDGEIQKTWKGEIGEKFKEYHKERAVYQIVHEKANLSILDSKKNQPDRFLFAGTAPKNPIPGK